MQKLSIVIFLLCINFINLFSQSQTLNDTMLSVSSSSSVYVSSVNLTGNFNELVIVGGFSDRTHDYPTINTNANCPPLGAFPDGTLIKDYVAAHGDHIPADDWLRPGLNSYFNQQSDGVYNVWCTPSFGQFLT